MTKQGRYYVVSKERYSKIYNWVIWEKMQVFKYYSFSFNMEKKNIKIWNFVTLLNLKIWFLHGIVTWSSVWHIAITTGSLKTYRAPICINRYYLYFKYILDIKYLKSEWFNTREHSIKDKSIPSVNAALSNKKKQKCRFLNPK